MSSVPGELARHWYFRLERLTAQDTLSLASLRERKWLRGVPPQEISAAERLAKLRGLDGVKAHIERLRWQMEAERRLRAEGRLKASPGSRHLVFTGNPGTGKTIVAELVGEIYREMGVLQRGHVVRAEAQDLVAGYVGQTAGLAGSTIDRALDGVLFIDEAYRLLDNEGRSGASFGQEAVDTLLVPDGGRPGPAGGHRGRLPGADGILSERQPGPAQPVSRGEPDRVPRLPGRGTARDLP